MFSICLYARYQSNSKEPHLKVVKKILTYIKNTVDYSLLYPKSSIFELMLYSDVDFVGHKSDRKSTSGTCHFWDTH